MPIGPVHAFWNKTAATRPVLEEYAQRGKFAAAVKLYQSTGMSAEGHRHYPLRPVKALRRSPETLLPLSPFLDDWGAQRAQAALASGIPRMKDDPNVAMDLIFSQNWNSTHAFMKFMYWAAPAFGLAFLVAWTRRPKKVRLMGRR